MPKLILKPRAGLFLVSYKTGEEGQPEEVHTDANAVAHEFLANPVELADGVTLQDIFALFNSDPLLTAVFRQDFAAELVAHARKGVHPDFKAGYHPDEIEFLELYAFWHYDSSQKELVNPVRLDLHGVGYELQDDIQRDGYIDPKGTRVTWGVALTDVRKLLPLPVKVRKEVTVYEDDVYSNGYGRELIRFNLNEVTLHQVLHGLLWELSFHGAPQDTEKVLENLQSARAELEDERESESRGEPNQKDQACVCHTAEELWTALLGDKGEASMRAHFVDFGGLPPMQVFHALRELEDQAMPEDALNEVFHLLGESRIRVAEDFRSLNARDLRAKMGKWDSEHP